MLRVTHLGSCDGFTVGFVDSVLEGVLLGFTVGITDGSSEGPLLGFTVGLTDGNSVGFPLNRDEHHKKNPVKFLGRRFVD